MMMIMRRVMCVLAVVLCCACGYTMAAAAAVDNDSPSGRGVSRGAVEVSCGAGGALRVRPAAASEWLTCGAGSRVSACGKYADLCRQRTARAAARTTTTRTAILAFTPDDADKPRAMENEKPWEWGDFLIKRSNDYYCEKYPKSSIDGISCEERNKTLSVNAPPQRQDLETRVQETAPNSADHVASGSLERRDALMKGEGQLPGSDPERATAEVSNVGSTTQASPESEQSLKTPPSNRPVKDAVTTQVPQTSGNAVTEEGPSANDSGTVSDSNPTEERSPEGSVSIEGLQGNGNADSISTAPPNTENTNTEAPNTNTTTVSPAESSIASTVQKNKVNADSSISPVWMRTAAPLLIVTVLFSVTVY
ncbi:uncharacterized protein TM35_000551130 [Trypanosoma theileri]|uniref:Mucin-associated surface protein (MASP) n=1 Tax=Trypanosoma theileri TaxID=67003 RepID=A0A1X0NGE4_9TRYP|nr:uncharacterized protein TM35_000551130 [Trypanosoma theileri]ORC83844.1 hypothetical protein TM35_000551130 [Trypanosoma theileri]